MHTCQLQLKIALYYLTLKMIQIRWWGHGIAVPLREIYMYQDFRELVLLLASSSARE
jgi:hypothetical protein